MNKGYKKTAAWTDPNEWWGLGLLQTVDEGYDLFAFNDAQADKQVGLGGGHLRRVWARLGERGVGLLRNTKGFLPRCPPPWSCCWRST
jgi:hypothetical protein